MSRPKGSKNKPKIKTEEPDELEIKKNNTLLVTLFGNVKEIKQEVRRLRKLKLQCRPGTVERLDLEHKIKDLKNQLTEQKKPDIDKDPIIEDILKAEKEQKIKPTFETLGIDLHKYTLEQLKIHFKNLTDKKVNAILN